MLRPKFRITCCLCGKAVPLASDVFALDAEWQRRFQQMRGTLACSRCATGTEWTCQYPNGGVRRRAHTFSRAAARA